MTGWQNRVLVLLNFSVTDLLSDLDWVSDCTIPTLSSSDTSDTSDIGGIDLISKQMDVRHRCNFGSLHGYWDFRRPEGERWRVFDPKCPLKNIVKSIGLAKNRSSTFSLLFLSDGADYKVMTTACKSMADKSLNTAEVSLNDQGRFLTANYCNFGDLEMAMRYIPGLPVTSGMHKFITLHEMVFIAIYIFL